MRRAPGAACFLVAFSLVVAACSSSTASQTGTPSGSPSAAATPSESATVTGATPTLPAAPTATKAPTATPKPTATPVRGQYLLYTTSVSITGGFRKQLWVVESNGTNKHKLVDGPNEPMASPPTHDITAAWSHDGATVHFVKYNPTTSTTTNCTPTITNISIDTGTAKTVGAALTNHDDNFLWSPDDTRILYRHWVGQPDCVQDSINDNTNLMVMNADGSGVHTIASNVTYQVTAWTKDGTSLIGWNTTTGRSLSISLSNGTATPIGPLAATFASVSPDGTGVAFVTSNRLHVANANGTGAIDLGATGDTDYGPVWSKDGTELAWQRTIGSAIKIFFVKLPGPGGTMLYSTASGLNGDIAWSPDGKAVAFSRQSASMVVAKTTGATKALSGTTNVMLISWQP